MVSRVSASLHQNNKERTGKNDQREQCTMHVVNERIQKNGDVYVTQVPHLCVCPRGSPRVDNDTLGWFDDE